MTSTEERSGADEKAAGPAFECRSVTVEFPHKFGRKRIIEDISFLVRSGEFLTIVGPSGTGKTTLLRAMGGLTPTASGSVLVHGKELDGPPEDVVIVFQDYSNALLQWRTIAANVAFGIERTLERRETEQRVHDALALVGLEKNADDYPWQLSGGMQQRVSIARALSFDPALLLMDEPFGALDEIVRDHLNEQLLQLWDKTGKTVLFVTHSIPEAVFLSTRIVVMSPRPGRIIDIIDCNFPRDRTLEIRETPEFLKIAHRVREGLRAGHAYDE